MTDDIKAGGGEAAADKKPAASSKKGGDKQIALTYVGPNRPYDLPLMMNQTFVGSAPDFCQSCFKDHSHLAECFVNVQALPQTLKALRDPGSAISRAVAKVTTETVAQRRAAAGGNL